MEKNKMGTLIAITYDDEQSGRGAFDALGEMQKQQLIQLEDAAFAIKDQKGKVKIRQTLERQHTGASASFGFFWGFLIGLIFGGPLFWGLATALLTGLLAKGTDLGIDNDFMREVSDSLEPGGSAIFVLVVKSTPDKVQAEMRKYGGHVAQTSLSEEDEQKLRQALEHNDVKAGVEESLDFDEDEEK
jgi:uncharacterized membrane protein